jgi:hypothetical protein
VSSIYVLATVLTSVSDMVLPLLAKLCLHSGAFIRFRDEEESQQRRANENKVARAIRWNSTRQKGERIAMSHYGTMIDPALSELPSVKDVAGHTCRIFVYERLGAAVYDAVGGGHWPVEVEVALRRLNLAVDAAIDADPVLREIFDAVPPAPTLIDCGDNPVPF